ncbi:MAG: hypothetical protein AB8B55_22430 [Mariniblastus sp.]
MKKQFLSSRLSARFTLVLMGLCLGWLARLLLGAPAEELPPARTIDRPLETVSADEIIDLPIIKTDSEKANAPEEDDSGLVPPIQIPGQLPYRLATLEQSTQLVSKFDHDADAIFEPHGEEVCASGCAASRHPTEHLGKSHFKRLLKEYTYEPINQTNNALEELLYYGPQTRKWIESEGIGDLDAKRADFLWNELKLTHARVSIRVTDQNGVVRSWIKPTRVPLDRRHIFPMETEQVQSLVTSGTVKRVGLNHAWVRL